MKSGGGRWGFNASLLQMMKLRYRQWKLLVKIYSGLGIAFTCTTSEAVRIELVKYCLGLGLLRSRP